MPQESGQPEITLPLPLRTAGRIPRPGPYRLDASVYLHEACPFMPGSPEKIAVLQLRALARAPLFRDFEAVHKPRLERRRAA